MFRFAFAFARAFFATFGNDDMPAILIRFNVAGRWKTTDSLQLVSEQGRSMMEATIGYRKV
jgi:hypothetical protein